jgi:hypothetical protein
MNFKIQNFKFKIQDSMKTAVGITLNNPLNIRKGGDVFIGEIVPGRHAAFKTFKTLADGYRAAFLTLGTYNLNGFDTIEKIVMRWAPPVENDSITYISHVSQWSGILKDLKLKTTDGDSYLRIVRAMSIQEVGKCFDADMLKGFMMQNRIRR